MVICLERGADLHMAQLMPLPLTVSCFSKIQIGFAFVVPAHPGSPGERAVKWMCVCVCVCGYCLRCSSCRAEAAHRGVSESVSRSVIRACSGERCCMRACSVGVPGGPADARRRRLAVPRSRLPPRRRVAVAPRPLPAARVAARSRRRRPRTARPPAGRHHSASPALVAVVGVQSSCSSSSSSGGGCRPR